MMHRDLKSPNVLLSEEGVAKIADVGMVRSQVKDLVTAQPVMTPLWAAPEVSHRLQLSGTEMDSMEEGLWLKAKVCSCVMGLLVSWYYIVALLCMACAV
jgi:serine/threonine protein kinase